MRNIHCRFASNHIVESSIDFIFCHGIQSGGRFIQDHKRGIFIERSGQCDFLCFSAGHGNTALIEVLIQIGIQSFGQLEKPLPKARLLQAPLGLAAVIVPTGCHIFPQRERKQLKILKYHGKQGHIFIIVILLNIDAV